MTASYTKLFSSILTSTIWGASHPTRIVWITLLALSDKNGEVIATIPGLARLASVSIEEAVEAIETLQKPDEFSRTADSDGRRIEPIDGGWALINHAKYRLMSSREDVKNTNAARQKRYRERQKQSADKETKNGYNKEANAGSVTKNADFVTARNGSVTQVPHIADTDTDTDTDAYKDAGQIGFDIDDQSERVSEKQKRKVGSAKASPVTDEEFFADLESDSCYAHVNILDEWAKMARWCGVNKKQATRRRFINWINRIDKPVTGPTDQKKEFRNAW